MKLLKNITPITAVTLFGAINVAAYSGSLNQGKSKLKTKTNFYSMTQFDKANFFILNANRVKVITENAKNVYLIANTELEYLGSTVIPYKYK